MNKLASLLSQRIAAYGPVPLADYMALALGHEDYGYYMQRQPFGRPHANGGDFTTAPEISQMFGELLGAWYADFWDRMGRPSPFALVELGPGRATLMADMLRAAAAMPGFTDAAQVHFVEISPYMQNLQAQKIPYAIWHKNTDTLPALPTLIVANEFFDALPIHQFKKTQFDWQTDWLADWLEICVGQMTDGRKEAQKDGSEKGRFAYIETPAKRAFSPAQKACLPARLRAGDIIETCPAAEATVTKLAAILTAHGGAALLIDYGYAAPVAGDSFQALRHHQPVDPLANPGQADLTAHVNFALLREAAQATGLTTSQITRQGDFLRRLGIDLRAKALATNTETLAASTKTCTEQIFAERDRLVAPDQMGHLFKVLGVAGPNMPRLAGFDT